MEDHIYHTAFYGDIRITADRDAHNRLNAATVEKLAGVIHGVEDQEELTHAHRYGGDRADGYVIDQDKEQVVSIKDVNIPPMHVTVVNTGKVRGRSYDWD